MDLTSEQKESVQNIVERFRCQKDFRCYKSGPDMLCKALDIGFESVLECVEEPSHACGFRACINEIRLCTCPLRVYLAKTLGR